VRRGVWIAGAAALALAGCRAARTSPPGAVSGAAQAKVELLRSLLRAHNDNDRRLDTEFNGLSPETKELFRREYRALPLEKRNQRGTIVFLLGRNLAEPEDWAFLREVVSEPPCLSLADCVGKPSSGGEEGLGDEVTLAYPQLVALKAAERVLAAGGPSIKEARSVVEAAKRSQAAIVARRAELLNPSP